MCKLYKGLLQPSCPYSYKWADLYGLTLVSLLLDLWGISTTRLKYLRVVGVNPLPALPLPFSLNNPWGLQCDPLVLHQDQCLSTRIHRNGWESTFSFSPSHIFFTVCLSSENTNGLKTTQIVPWRLTTSSHLLIELVLPLNPTYLSQSTHSKNFSQTQAFPFLFLFSELFLPICFYHCTAHFWTSFLFNCTNDCSSTLVPLTNTHSHHKLTTHAL